MLERLNEEKKRRLGSQDISQYGFMPMLVSRMRRDL